MDDEHKLDKLTPIETKRSVSNVSTSKEIQRISKVQLEKGGLSKSVSRKKLASMPLSILLPRLGELSLLHSIREKLQKRHQELLALKTTNAEELSREILSEESMINQILQWLSVPSGEGS